MNQISFHIPEAMTASIEQEYAQMKTIIADREIVKKRSHQVKDIHFLSANLQSFMPEIEEEEHEGIYLRLITNHAIRSKDIGYLQSGNLTGMNSVQGLSFLKEYTDKPGIFCTYHMGAYRGIIGILAFNNINIALVVDTKTKNRQADEVLRTVSDINRQTGLNTQARVLDAEALDIGVQLTKAIQEKYSIVIFLDGNSGNGGVYKRDTKSLKVKFLNSYIWSRTGIALISYATKTPVIPVISFYEEQEGKTLPKSTFRFFNPIVPDWGKVRMQEYVHNTTRELYGVLETYLKKYVDQWESLFYFHKFIDLESIPSQNKPELVEFEQVDPALRFRFHNKQFGLFKLNDDCYLLNKRTYQTFPLKPESYEALFRLNQPISLREIQTFLSESQIRTYRETGIIISE